MGRELFTEIEAFKILFDLEAKVILAGGIKDSKGAVGFLVEGKRALEAIEFANRYNNLEIIKNSDFIY